MRTITIQIGNSDDKLTQTEWSRFVRVVQFAIANIPAIEQHFFGSSPTHEQWQNAAWVIVCGETDAARLRENVADIRKRYRQDSVAWTEGETSFV